MRDEKALARSLHRLVYVDKLLTRDESDSYCALVGLSMKAVEDG